MNEVEAREVKVGDMVRTRWAGFQKVVGKATHEAGVTLVTLFGEINLGISQPVEVLT